MEWTELEIYLRQRGHAQYSIDYCRERYEQLDDEMCWKSENSQQVKFIFDEIARAYDSAAPELFV